MSDGTSRPPADPILAPGGSPPATASRPDRRFEDASWHAYDANPAPWWLGILWVGFFVFAVTYLIRNLLQ